MASTQILKRRVRSVKNTRQITKAMELVAASKMRRVEVAAKSSRAYSDIAYSVINRVSGATETALHPYFRPAPKTAKEKLYIVFSSDRGLAGALNSNIMSRVIDAAQADTKAGYSISVIAFGRRGARFFAKLPDVQLLSSYESLPDIPDASVFAPVTHIIDEGMKTGKFATVSLFYTAFTSTLVQTPTTLSLLPLSLEASEKSAQTNERAVVFEFEPSADAVLETAANLYIDSQLMQAKVESAASEHAMRMLAMSSASRNAGDIIDSLTLELNATRQAAITQEIAEITGGAEAIA